MGTAICHYEPGLEKELVDLWNRSLKYDPINVKVFERKVLLDPNFEAEGLKVAVHEGRVVGFALCIVRRYPLYYQGLEEDKGWITALAVEPGLEAMVGPKLLDEALSFFREKGRKTVWFSSYTPNYFFPGVDYIRYEWLLELLESRGFEPVYEAISMDAQLWPNYTIPDWVIELERRLAQEGLKITHLSTKYVYSFLKFLERNFSADWYRHALELLQRGCDKEQVLIAVKNGEVVGYCQYWHSEDYDWYKPGAHFGPIGVREDMRGRGVGSVLLAKCLWSMKSRGIHNAFLLWTDERAARFYSRFGFKVTRRFKVMRKQL